MSTKSPGRIREILVNEGEFVTAGQVLALMDTDVLEAQLREAEAQLSRATIGVETAKSSCSARPSAPRPSPWSRSARRSSTRQRTAGAHRDAERDQRLSHQALDDDRANVEGARAAVAAAQAQVAAAEAAISAALAEWSTPAPRSTPRRPTIERIQADIDDSALKAPRDGRVQYRVAQPGEVLAAGGRVLNMVDLSDVYMTFFLPTAQAGRVALGAEVRLVLDAAAAST